MPVLLLGGTEIQAISLVRLLIDAGYKVDVCCYYEYDSNMVKRFEEAGAKVLLMKYERAKGLWHLAKGLMKLFKTINPDIVHVQYLAPGLIPVIAARLDGIRTVFATVHIAGSVAYGRKAKFLLRSAAKFCTAFFCVSKGVEQFWFGSSEVFEPDKANKNRRHFTIYNAVDASRIAQAVENINRNELRNYFGIRGKAVIGIVGRLAQQKGHSVLLDAMAAVVGKFPDIVLLIIGEGPDRLSLEYRAKSLNIDKHILWMGALPQDKVFEFYSIIDIFVMPSLYEGFGLAAAEAQAAGLPVVASAVDGLNEIVESGVTGYLVPAGESATLANALTDLLSDREKAREMGQKGRERAREMFSLKGFQRSMLAAYEKLSI